MSTEHRSIQSQSAVRYSRILTLPRATALGSSVTVGLGAFVLLSLVLGVGGSKTTWAYGLWALVFIPTALALAERGAAWHDQGGISRFGSVGVAPWRLYTFFWLSLGGLTCLAALFSWGVAYHISRLFERLFTITLDELYLAIGAIVLMAWYRSIMGRGALRTSLRVIMISLPVFAILLGWGWYLARQSVLIARFGLQVPSDIVQATALLGAMLWGLMIILTRRNQIPAPHRNLLPALIGTLILGSLAGMAASYVVLKNHGLVSGDPLALASIARSSDAGLEMILLLIGLLLCLLALDWTLVSGQRLIIDNTQEGFIPKQIKLPGSKYELTTGPLFLITTISALVLILLPFADLASLTALLFYAFIVVILLPDMLPGQKTLPDERLLKLPFYPLIPALAVVVSLYFSLALKPNAWLLTGSWALLGGIYYLVYARQAGIDAWKRERVITEPIQLEKSYRVLVEIVGRGQLESLLHIGEKLVKARDGQLLVLRVIAQPEQLPVDRWLTQQAHQSLKSLVKEFKSNLVPVDAIVRVAPTRADGILETVREEDIDLVLINWKTVQVSGELTLDPEIDQVVQHAPCDVGVLRGKLSAQLQNITVSTAGGPHAAKALKYGASLSEAEDGHVTALNIVPGVLTPEREAEAEERLHNAIVETGAQNKFTERIAPASDIREGILQESDESDLLLIGASTRGLLDEAVFAGIPFNVARTRSKATLLIKHYEGTRQFWLRQAWEFIYRPFPTLTVAERAEVTESIQESAIAGVDYYLMTVLSAVIAVLGLITNSAAVIIGAMLVAPLMSPILVMAHSIVLGDIRVLAKAAESTMKGVVAAIVVAAAIAIVVPPQPLTSEILARTQPNLFDLMVAVASGAAAAYAISRKHLAAALPGVAIAAALVPPLSVVGIGLGYSMYNVAGGAMLLFITNLSAIVLSGALVFLLLGFRPTRAEQGRYMQRWILLSLALLLIIAVPLGIATVNLSTRLDLEREVQAALDEIVSQESAEIENVTIQQQGDGYLVSGTIYAYQQMTKEDIDQIQAELRASTGASIALRIRVVPARLEEIPP